MPKPRAQFICRTCGSVHPRWMGKCPDCNTWDALEKVEPAVAHADAHATLVSAWHASAPAATSAAAQSLPDEIAGEPPADDQFTAVSAAVPLPDIRAADTPRIPTRIEEFDRVLGGGLVPGSVVLIGGDPGIGKSTLLLQAAGRLATGAAAQRVLYVSSEESAHQARLRSQRLFTAGDQRLDDSSRAKGDPLADMRSLFILADTNLLRIAQQARQVQPAVMVIDSIQMVYRPDIPAAPGSVTQVRRCCMDLVYLAKSTGMSIILVGHVTKDGQVAGPKLLEHLVDVVLLFEGDHHHACRMVRGVKNRFGTTLEVGLFEMADSGLHPLVTPFAHDGATRHAQPGSIICPTIHGSRCILVEVQALTATGILGAARRKASGLDVNRLAMLIAVLEKHGGLRLADQDVYASSVGGLRIAEPAVDLAVCLAVAGAQLGRALPSGVAVAGEIGLNGEIRGISHVDHRVREAERLGYTRVFVPFAGRRIEYANVEPLSRLSDAMALLEPVATIAKSKLPNGNPGQPTNSR